MLDGFDKSILVVVTLLILSVLSILQAVVLGLIQGITEFLPISSSGHLVLAESLFGLKVDQLLEFDVTVHVATLVAILVFFRKDFSKLIGTFFRFDFRSQSGQEIVALIMGTIPAVCLGLLAGTEFFERFRTSTFVGIAMVITAIYFLLVESYLKKGRARSEVTHFKGFLIGIAQMIAILPGVSRSGSTIATAMLLGQDRLSAARFSFLLGSIAIAGAGLLTTIDVAKQGSQFEGSSAFLIVGFFSSLAASYFTVSFLMKFLRKNSLNIFAAYLIVIGLVALISGILV